MEYKQLAKNVLFSTVSDVLENKYNITLPHNKQNVDMLDGIVNNDIEISLDKFNEMGISQDIIEEVESMIPGMKQLVDLQIQFFDENFNALNDSIYNVARQMHLDKIMIAGDIKEQFEKRIDECDISDMLSLRGKAEDCMSGLKSDIENRIRQCEAVPKKRKPLFGGRIKDVERALNELKEVLPVYVQTVSLLSQIELILWKKDSAKKSLQTAMQYLQTRFAIQNPENNRMHTLTDEDYWWEQPKEFCEEMAEAIKNIEKIETKLLTVKN